MNRINLPLTLALITAVVGSGPAVTAQKKAKPGTTQARPTLRIAKGTLYDFKTYFAVNGLTYNPDGTLRIDDINKAWAGISDVIIEGTLVINRDPQKPNDKVNSIFVVNRLEIGDGGAIVTNGNVLTVFANEFVAQNNASITSFPSGNKASSASATDAAGLNGNSPGAAGGVGPAGQSGAAGESGGVLTIITSRFEGPLGIDLRGQGGGNGGKGGRGGNGAQGVGGSAGQCNWFLGACVSCNQGGGNGAAGGPAGQGGIGGGGGRGGDGGSVTMAYVNSTTVGTSNPKIVVSGGLAGTPGGGGDAGSPGLGGPGGSGIGLCGGGSGGPAGPGNQPGPSGPAAAPATNGTSQLLKLASQAKVQEAFARAVQVHQGKPLLAID